MHKRKSKKAQILILLFLNFIFIGILIFSMTAYGILMYKEAEFFFRSAIDDNIINSQAVSETLSEEARNGTKIDIKPVLQIPDPVNRNFAIVIPKIQVNNPIISNVDINNNAEVEKALGEGLGWAKGTVPPGEDGNSLIFSHSTQNAIDMFRYNSIFTLLDKMEVNDMFSIFYEGRQMDFIVFEKQVVYATDLSYITSNSNKGKVVTLQTCHPAGTDTYRLLVRGRLVAMELLTPSE